MILIYNPEPLLVIGDKAEIVQRWEVWFSTPKGLVVKLTDAYKMCAELDWPLDVIRPVPVAIGETMWEVCP